MSQYRSVVLDIDGTLVDSNDAHAKAWAEAFAAQDIEVSYQAVRQSIGMGGDKLIPAVCGIDAETERGKKIAKLRGQIFLQKHLPTIRPFARVTELLQTLKERGYRLVVATSAQKEEAAALLKICGADSLIDGQTTSDDAEESKPDPDIIHAALQKSGFAPERNIMLGDTPYDVAAATLAGVAIIAVRCGGWADAALQKANAIYDDPADLLAHLSHSPLG